MVMSLLETGDIPWQCSRCPCEQEIQRHARVYPLFHWRKPCVLPPLLFRQSSIYNNTYISWELLNPPIGSPWTSITDSYSKITQPVSYLNNNPHKPKKFQIVGEKTRYPRSNPVGRDAYKMSLQAGLASHQKWTGRGVVSHHKLSNKRGGLSTKCSYKSGVPLKKWSCKRGVPLSQNSLTKRMVSLKMVLNEIGLKTKMVLQQ